MTYKYNANFHPESGVSGQEGWLPRFTTAVNSLAQDPAQPISAAWAMSRLGDEAFLASAQDFHAADPAVSPSEAQRRFLSAEQAVLLDATSRGDHPFPDYPSEDYADTKVWSDVYRWLQTDQEGQEGYGKQCSTNRRRGLTTSVPQRAVAARFVRRVASHHIGREELAWANCGCGNMSGLRLDWLSGRDPDFGFKPVSVVDNNPRAAIGSAAVSAYKSDIFNSIVRGPDRVKRMVGIDREDPDQAWTRACLRPEELLSGEWDALQAGLMSAYVPDEWLGFYLADFANRGEMRKVAAQEGLDGAQADFSWYPGSAKTRRNKLLNIRDAVAPDGMFVISDSARTVGHGRFLAPRDTWDTFTVHVGWRRRMRPVMQTNSGRFSTIQVLPALGGLARGGPYEREVRELLA